MATDGAAGVDGGNWRIFEKFLQFSGATVSLNTTVCYSVFAFAHPMRTNTVKQVKSLSRKADSSKWTLQTWSGSPADYSSVILAAPYHQTDIKISSPTLDDAVLSARVPPQPYIHLHVTLLTTTAAQPNPKYFGLETGAKVPKAVLTTHDGVRTRGGKEPEFHSLTYHGLARGKKGTPTEGEEEEWLVKIFSKQVVTDKWLAEMFNGKVGWVHRKEVCCVLLVSRWTVC